MHIFTVDLYAYSNFKIALVKQEVSLWIVWEVFIQWSYNLQLAGFPVSFVILQSNTEAMLFVKWRLDAKWQWLIYLVFSATNNNDAMSVGSFMEELRHYQVSSCTAG